jgi:hypothetical protein
MLTSIISSQSSTRSSSSGEIGITPALLMSTSSLPYRSRASATRAERSSRLRTSVGAWAASPPDSTMRSTSAASLCDARAPNTTFAPRSASTSAVASPIPLLAPVIATTLPSISHIPFSSQSLPARQAIVVREDPPEAWAGAECGDRSHETQRWRWPERLRSRRVLRCP